MEEQSFEGELTFSNTDYLVSVKQIQQSTFDPLNQRLYVEVEEKLTGNIWKGDFQAKYIEDITAKTGIAKKFNVFVKMLIQALKSQNDSVCIDLLTYADLEALKNKRPANQNTSQNQTTSTNNKRYFILTYITEFEKVHYPLSLNYVDEPEADQLRRTIDRMRNLILMQKSNAFSSNSGPGFFGQPATSKNLSQTASQAYNKIEDFASIELENEQLRRQINEMESQFSQSHQEFFNLSQQKFYTESEYDKYKRNAQKEIMNLQDNVRNAESELQQLQDQLRNQQSINASNRVTQTSGFSLNSGQVQNSQISDVDHVKRQLEEVTSQLDQERSTTGTIIEKQGKEIEECKKEVDEQKENEKKLKLRQKELQDELDYTLKRIEQLQRGVSTPIRRKNPIYNGTTGGAGSGAGSRNASPYSRNNSGNKKQANGTPTGGSKTNLYNRGTGGNATNSIYNRNGSNGRTNAAGGVGVQRQSPTTQNRFGSNTYKPPSSLRQTSNTRQSPTTNQRVPIGGQRSQQPTSNYQRNTSNNRSGSNNNRTSAGTGNMRGTNYSNGSGGNSNINATTGNRPMVGVRGNSNQNQKNAGQSSTAVYDRLYGNKVGNKANPQIGSNQTNKSQVVDYQIPERDLNNATTDSLNINIMNNGSKIYDNKENNQQMIQSSSNRVQQQNKYSNAYEPVSRAQDDTGGSNAINYDNIKDDELKSKLSRIQELISQTRQQ